MYENDRKHHAERCSFRITVLFDFDSDRKWSRVLSIILSTWLHVIMVLSYHGCESEWTAKHCHNRQWRGHVLLLTFLLTLSFCKDHVYCFAVFLIPRDTALIVKAVSVEIFESGPTDDVQTSVDVYTSVQHGMLIGQVSRQKRSK